MARLNRDLIEAELSFGQIIGDLGELKLAPAPVPSQHLGDGNASGRRSSSCRGRRMVKENVHG